MGSSPGTSPTSLGGKPDGRVAVVKGKSSARSSSPFAATPDPFLDLPTYPIGCLSIPSTADAAAASAVSPYR